ncbi:MAG: arylsulfatase [Planctomycetota bacterium]
MKCPTCLLACLVLVASVHANPSQPDIVIILVDDMGYSDIGCYGGEVQTPTLNKLAEQGVRFTQFYNAGRCCPTRASLLTGLYPHQAGVGHMIGDKGKPGYIGRLNERSVTIAEVLKTAGYHTVAAGKWHVSPFSYGSGQGTHKGTWPLQRGFDRFIGTLAGGGNFYHPKTFMHDNVYKEPGEGFYYTDVISDATVQFINEAPKDKPLFAYVAHTAPHWPLHAHEEDIAKYDGVYDAGWDVVRKARHKRMVEMGIIDGAWQLPERDKRVQPWSEKPNHCAWRSQLMQVHAAMIDRVDQGIAKIVEALKQRGTLDNTMIVFLSDNGASEETPGMPGIKRFAKDGFDTSQWGNKSDVTPGGPHTFQSFGIPWANVSNTPFRWYKSEMHEGGIATPLVFYYPPGTASDMRGKLVHEPGHIIDFMATCVDLSNASYPETFGDRTVDPMEGVSLSRALKGKSLQRAAPLFFEHQDCAAIRDGQWKLVRLKNKPWELYDMHTDRTETNNLAKQHPERVKQMAEQWQAWAERTNVFPKP